MDTKFTDYIKEKFLKNNANRNNETEKPTKTAVKNNRVVFRKAAALSVAVVATVALLSGCGAVNDRVITDEEANGVNFSNASQEELNLNRWFGNLIGVDRGNVFGQNDPSQETTSETTQEVVQPETKPQEEPEKEHPTVNTQNPEDQYFHDSIYTGDGKEETSENDTTVVEPQPEETTPPETQPEELPTDTESTTETVNMELVNNFDVFIQTYLMITGKDATNAKFVAIKPVKDNVNGSTYERPYYFKENGFSPTLQPGMDFSTQVYTGTIIAEVNGKKVSIGNIAMGVDEFQAVLNSLGASQFNLSQEFVGNLPSGVDVSGHVGTNVYEPVTISRSTIENASNSAMYQELLDTIILANANCVEPDLANGMGR